MLPLGPFVDDVLNEPIRKRFSRFDAKRLDNLKAIEEREAEIAEWHAANEEKEDEEKEGGIGGPSGGLGSPKEGLGSPWDDSPVA